MYRKYIFLISSFFLAAASHNDAQSQTGLTIFSEDFSAGASYVQLNSNATGMGSNSGTNQWVINSVFAGNANYPVTTSQFLTNGGLFISSPDSNYLHIHDSASSAGIFNCSYDVTIAADRWAYLDTVICTKSHSNIEFSFAWLSEGDTIDYGEIYYSADGGPWTKTGKSKFNSASSLYWTKEVITDPEFANRESLRFAFRWINGFGIAPNKISFGVDDILVTGDFDSSPTGPQLNFTAIPASVCKASNMTFGFSLSDTMCGGNYVIQLINNASLVVGTWNYWLNCPQTVAVPFIWIGGGVAPGTCYRLRLSRISQPALGMIVSSCFDIVTCPLTITTLVPAVASSASAYASAICVGSVIDVQFWSYGTLSAGNVYTAQLSDSSGNFASPLTIGTLLSSQGFDPAMVPDPGSIAGTIPAVPDGCGYFICVKSSNPAVTGTLSGPFCIKDCDIVTNNGLDILSCISSQAGDTIQLKFSVNNPPSNVVYCAFPGNTMNVQVLDFNTLAQVNVPGTLGMKMKVTSSADSITLIIPPADSLATAGMASGRYYLRVSATCGIPSNNLDGSIVRLTIGAPADSFYIIPNPKYLCKGNVSNLTIGPPGVNNPESSYQWYLNGSKFGPPPNNSPIYPLGVLFNGSPGPYKFEVQESNYGCLGPKSPADSVWVVSSISGNITGYTIVCIGETITYSVPYYPNTTYNWLLTPGTHGTILSVAANAITIRWDSVTPTYETVQLVNATNVCGSVSASRKIYVGPQLFANAGKDTAIWKGDTLLLGGNPTAWGGTLPFKYSWYPDNTVNDGTLANPAAWPNYSGNYYLLITDGFKCEKSDQIYVTVIPVVSRPENESGPEFTAGIFPNPVSNKSILLIELRGSQTISVEILDALGQTVGQEQSFAWNKKIEIPLDASGLPAGIYFAVIRNDSRSEVIRFFVRN